MKKTKLLFILITISFVFSIFLVPVVNAQNETTPTPKPVGKYTLQVPLGTYTESVDMFEYVKYLYQIAIAFLVVLAVIMVMVGGILYLTAAGNPQKIGEARGYIVNALAGLMIGLFSYVLLYQINPKLTQLGFRTSLDTANLAAFEFSSEEVSGCVNQFTVKEITDKCSLVDVGDFNSNNISSGTNDLMLTLTPEAAKALKELTKEYGKITINSGFRDPIKQGCLATKNAEVAAPSCVSVHTKGLGIDVDVKSMSTEDYCKFVVLAKTKGWKLNTYVWEKKNKNQTKTDTHTWWSHESTCIDAVKKIDFQNYVEVWHFTYQGPQKDFSSICPTLVDKKGNQLCP